MSRPSSEELLEIALAAARAAADLVREHRRGEVTVAATKSSDIDVVTEADQASEALIRKLVLGRRPDDGFLGEEGVSTGSTTENSAGTSGVRWIVDPIDGTVNFLYDIPQYAVSVAAERDGEVVAGVVLNIATGTEYAAYRRTGPDGPEGPDAVVSTRDGGPISVNSPAPLSKRLIGTGFHYELEVRAFQTAAVARLLPRIRDLRRLGSCALDLCHVAEGRLDGYVEEGVNPWDHAAGALVAEGAGARSEVTIGAGGRDLIVCAPAHGFQDLRDAVREAGFLRR